MCTMLFLHNSSADICFWSAPPHLTDLIFFHISCYFNYTYLHYIHIYFSQIYVGMFIIVVDMYVCIVIHIGLIFFGYTLCLKKG